MISSRRGKEMDLESHRKIYNTVREACLTGTFDHHNYLSEQNDGLEERRQKYLGHLNTVRQRYYMTETRARTQHRLDFMRAGYESTVAAELSARRAHTTIGARFLMRQILFSGRSRAIQGNDLEHETMQSLFLHPILQGTSPRTIERVVRDGVVTGDFISIVTKDDARKRFFSVSVDTSFDIWCETLTAHVIRGLYMHPALDMRQQWMDAWQTRLGMPKKIIELAYETRRKLDLTENIVNLSVIS